MIKRWIDLLKQTFKDFNDDKCPQMGAALAFYTIGSLIPLLLIIVSIFTYVFFFTGYGETIQADLLNYIGQTAGEEIEAQLNTIITNRTNELASGSIISVIVGFATLLFTASGVFGQLDAAFDEIWDVPEDQKPSGIFGTIRAKLFSFGMLLSVAFLLLVSLILTQLVSTFTRQLSEVLPIPAFLVQGITYVVNLAVVTGVFALMFKVLPNTDVEWGDVWRGALLTSALWAIGQFVLSIYFRSAGFTSYGIIGGVLAFLAYIYYSSQIIFFGAEFTGVYAHAHGSRAAGAETKPGLTPAGVLMAQTIGASRQREVDRARADAEAARSQRVMAAATGGVVGALGAVVLAGVAVVGSLVVGLGRLRRG